MCEVVMLDRAGTKSKAMSSMTFIMQIYIIFYSSDVVHLCKLSHYQSVNISLFQSCMLFKF